MKRTEALLVITGTLTASALLAVGLTSAPPAETRTLAAPAATVAQPSPAQSVIAEQIALRKEAAERATRAKERAALDAKAKAEARTKKQAAAKKAAAAKPKPAPAPHPKPTKKTQPSGSDAEILACIRKHESGGNYRAVNSTGKFRGAYQFHSGYAPTWAKRAGHGEWSGTSPDRWPPSVQDDVAYFLGHSNRYAPWRNFTSYSCPW